MLPQTCLVCLKLCLHKTCISEQKCRTLAHFSRWQRESHLTNTHLRCEAEFFLHVSAQQKTTASFASLVKPEKLLIFQFGLGSQAVDELTRKLHKLNKYAACAPLVSALHSSFSCTSSLLNASYFENNPETDPSVVGWRLISTRSQNQYRSTRF